MGGAMQIFLHQLDAHSEWLVYNANLAHYRDFFLKLHTAVSYFQAVVSAVYGNNGCYEEGFGTR